MRALDPRLIRRGRAVRALLVVDSALAVLMALLVLAQAILLARVAADAFSGASLEQVSTPLVLLVAAVAARAVAGWGFEVAGRRAAASVISELRRDVVDTRLNRQPSALDGVQSAEVATAAVSGVDALETTFARYVPQAALATVVPFAVLILVASIDLLAAGVMLLTLPLVPIFMWLVGRHTERRARERYEARAVLSNHFLDVVRGLPTLRAFNRAHAQTESIVEVSDAYRRSTMATLRIAFLSGSILELAATLGIALVAVIVGIRLSTGGIAFQPALTVLVLAPELYLPLRNLAAQFHASADGSAVAARMLELTEAPCVAGTAEPPDPTRHSIAFEGVAYRYPTRDTEVLHDVTFVIDPGEMVAIVGPSGGGKSTLISLLMRFADPSAGRILVGGHDLARCDPQLWRQQTAFVPQHPTLFRGTIAENLRLGDRHADDGAVRRAAELAGAHTFVAGLPQGYETVVGDGGRQLSAGQRRRLALARAFLRTSPILLLDEPTADLDEATAGIVIEAIERLRVGRTVLLVAHRPELAARADRIVHLDRGRVLEQAAAAAAAA